MVLYTQRLLTYIQKSQSLFLLRLFLGICFLCISLASVVQSAPGDTVVTENIPAGVSHELFGKIYLSKNITAADLTLSATKSTAVFTSANLPILITKTSAATDIAEVTLKFTAGTMDLSAYNAVDFVVENLSSQQITLNFIPYGADTANKPGFWNEFIIPPKSQQTHFLTTLDVKNVHYCSDQSGMQRCPIGPNQLPAIDQSQSRPMDLKTVINYRVRLVNAPLNAQIKINLIKAVKMGYRPEDMPGLIDKYGQNRWMNFDGKVMKDQDLRDDAAKESAVIKPLPARWDQYGGDKTAGGYGATGFFRVEKVNGKWWFVNPLGNLTYLSGLSLVSHRGHETTIKGREVLFQELPPKTGNTATVWADRACLANNQNIGGVGEFCGGMHWSPYLNNLYIKYQDPAKPFNQDEILKRWGTTTQNRFYDWGFNLTDGVTSVQRYFKMPYVLMIDLNNQGKKIPGALMPDVYDPLFKSSTQAYFKKFITDRKIPGTTNSVNKDPYLVGFFSDNELDFGHSWTTNPTDIYYLILHIFKQLGTSVPAKKALTDKLKAKYVDLNVLKTAWAQPLTLINTWDDFSNNALSFSSPFNAAFIADLSMLLKDYAEVYYSTMKDILKVEAPNHMYIGNRFAGFHRTPKEAIDACVKYCDVFSINYYETTLIPAEWGYLLTKDKPIFITEYHFGAPTHGGSWGGNTWFTNQQERQEAYINFVKEVQTVYQIVGNVYQPYVDRPLTGVNFAYQNSFVGFLTTVDRPYPKMVEAAKLVNHSVYDVRGSLPKEVVNPQDPDQMGDVSLNGRLTLYDVTLILRYLSGYQLSQQQLLKADVDSNSIINGADAESIKQKTFYGIEYPVVK